jgi:hypothetical protein
LKNSKSVLLLSYKRWNDTSRKRVLYLSPICVLIAVYGCVSVAFFVVNGQKYAGMLGLTFLAGNIAPI